jgi:hypothetical protein
VLTIPAKVTNIHNSASTFKVYDPNKATGNTDPLAPAPPAAGKGKKCGVLGQILMVAIAVAVTALLHVPVTSFFTTAFAGGAGATVTAGAALAGTIVGGAVTGAIASTVSQGFGVATGIQDKFSWKAVGIAAISAAVGGGGSTGNFVTDAINSAISNVAVQGIAVATGLQNKFDWTGVAAAGIGGGVGGQVKLGGTGGRFVASMADALANAATRSVIDGTDFGDNIIAALPSVIGNTIGNLAASRLSRTPRLAYADMGSDDSVAGGGTSGAGDGTQAQPVTGVGGGQIGRGAFSGGVDFVAGDDVPQGSTGSTGASSSFPISTPDRYDPSVELIGGYANGQTGARLTTGYVPDTLDAGTGLYGHYELAANGLGVFSPNVDLNLQAAAGTKLFDQQVGFGLLTLPAAGASLALGAVAAPAVTTAAFANAYPISVGLGIAGEGATGVPLFVPVGVAGAGLAAENVVATEARGGVYVLRNPAADDVVVRSGRTIDLTRREADHLRDPALKDFDFDTIYRTDVYNEQRGLEQVLHDTYQPPLNKIRPISPTNKNYNTYMEAAKNYLGN